MYLRPEQLMVMRLSIKIDLLSGIEPNNTFIFAQNNLNKLTSLAVTVDAIAYEYDRTYSHWIDCEIIVNPIETIS